MNIVTSYYSAKVIDEIHLNNQRAYLLFNEYFKSNGENIVNVELINHREAFYYPNFTNKNICKFIRYGQFSIGAVLAMSTPAYYTGSVLK